MPMLPTPGAIRRLIVVFLFLACLPRAAAPEPFQSVTGPCRLSFPADHASHPDHRIEWWYYTGNLRAENGEHFGFQLTFFRIGITPPGAQARWPREHSAWRTDRLIAAHAAVSDMHAATFHHHEKMARAALGLAGTREENGRFSLFANGWRAVIEPDAHSLAAETPDFSFSLDLTPRKNAVPHGDSGYSRKGAAPDEASCYYSITRFDAAGKLAANGRERRVRGTAWMDHEFSSAPLDPLLAGWDWFGLQLSDGSDLMLYLMREKSGALSPVSSGTFVDAEGKSTHLSFGDFRVRALSGWKSLHTGAVYPSSWRIEVFPLDLRITVAPNMEDQEMQSPGSTNVTYWEGSVAAEGTAARGRPVTGLGYVELTGYAGPVDF